MEKDYVPENKAHHKAKSGPKAEKRKTADAKKKGSSFDQQKNRNPKAFALNSPAAYNRDLNYALNKELKKHHAPLVDRSGAEPPPIIVAVQGPPGVGKSSLIRSLVKHYTMRNLKEVKGPVTVVTSKTRRTTFVEVPNDLSAAVDIAKVADLVLLLVDAAYGFEMETFEFLNVLQAHGFPKIMGVLTHLDLLKGKHQKKAIKKLKHRFWAEVHDGAKLFYLKGMKFGRYMKIDVRNLSRYMSLQKFRPLIWRNAHSYVLVDRILDVTPPDEVTKNKKCDRTVCFYGYVHGPNLKPSAKIHIPGVGDFFMKDVSILSDPCPRPDKGPKQQLGESDKIIYCPMADLGIVSYDRDATFIEFTHKPIYKKIGEGEEAVDVEEGGEGEAMVRALHSNVETVEDQLESTDFQLFSNSKPIPYANGMDIDKKYDSDANEASESDSSISESDDENRSFDEGEYNDDDEDNDDDDDAYYRDDDSENGAQESSTQMSGHKRRAANFEHSGSAPKVSSRSRPTVNDDSEEEDQDGLQFDDQLDSNDVSEGSESGESQDSDADESNSEDNAQDSDDEEARIEAKIKESLARKRSEEDEGSIDDEPTSDGLQWKESLASKAAERLRQPLNLMKLVYGGEEDKEKGNYKKDKPFVQIRTAKSLELEDIENQVESSRQNLFDRVESALDFRNDLEIAALLKARFVSKGTFLPAGDAVLEDDKTKLDPINDQPLYGDFEDLETGQKVEGSGSEEESEEAGSDTDEDTSAMDVDYYSKKKAEQKKAFDDAYDTIKATGGDMEELHHMIEQIEESEDSDVPEIAPGKKSSQKSKESKGLEHDWYTLTKESMVKQQKMNQQAFATEDPETRKLLEGVRSGTYIRVEINAMPFELVEHFDPRYPILLGALLQNEHGFGLIQARIKKHRWHSKILKTHDPLIMSIGWRRFQTMPVYSIESHGRNRMLKYTPEYMHCLATFYGPTLPPNTGIICFQKMSNDTSGFRVAANGVILEINKKFEIVKKLKLMGTPFKIKGHTAYIRGMFNSKLEVAKFTGASIKTVSGIRGSVKKAIRTQEGAFRAGFEDKILMSDLVFLRTWYPVEPKSYYNPVTSLLLQKKDGWVGMKTTGQIRYERNISVPKKKDSEYKPIERPEVRKFDALKVPKKLEQKLSYSAIPKMDAPRRKSKDEQLHSSIRILDPHEKRTTALINDLNYLRNQAVSKQKARMREKMAKYKVEKDAEEDRKLTRQKENKKRIWRMEGSKPNKKAKFA